MATYAELREEVLRTLEVPVAMTGSLRSLVDIRLYRAVEHLVSLVKPVELLTQSSGVTIDSTTTSITLTDFGITDLAIPVMLTIDTDTTDEHDPEVYEFVSYQAWIRNVSASSGSSRKCYTFTLDPSNSVIIESWPDGTAQWTAYLWYYKQPDAISDSGEPPFPVLNHGIVATKTILAFPHRFLGERKALYQFLQQEYQAQLSALLKSRQANFANLKFRASEKLTRGHTWGIWPKSRLTS